jgi:hypothetical protein
MTNFTEKAPSDQTPGAADLTPKAEEALRFLELLGKNRQNTYFRTIERGKGANKRRRGADLRGFDLKALQRDNATAGIYAVIGEATGATSKDEEGRPTGCVCDEDICSLKALFVEWDDRSIHEQLTAWEKLGLPRPSFQVETGGKSIHSYWVLDEAVSPEQWVAAQLRLIAHCGSDGSLNNPGQLMRVPGFTYFNKANKDIGTTTRLINVTGTHYSLGEVLANVPELAAVEPTPNDQDDDEWEPRCLEEIKTAAKLIPQRVPGQGKYERDRNVLCACSAALEQAGVANPDEAALELLGHLWPSEREARQVLKSTTTRNPAAFWAVAGEKGHEFWPNKKLVPETEEDQELARDAALSHVANAASTLDLRDVLHPWLADRLIRRAESFPLHPLALLAPGLATCAALVGTRARVEVKDDWDEPLVIWAGNVADASTLKSAASNVWQKPLVRIEIEERIKHKASKKRQNPEETEKQDKPLIRYIAGDATYEAIASMAAAPSNFGIISYQDELSAWFANLERQCSANARGSWLSLWGGSSIIVDRKTTDSLFAPESAVSLFGNVQPDKLAAMMARTGDGAETAGDGLWSRFLWIRPPFVRYSFVDKSEVISGDIYRLLKLLHQVPIGTNSDEKTVFRFSQDATDLMAPFWVRWADWELDSSPARRAFLGKMRGYSARLAGLLGVIDAACEAIEQQDEMVQQFRSTRCGRWLLLVEEGHAKRALRLCEFFLAQFDALQNSLGHGDVPPNVAKLLACIERTDSKSVPVRQIGRWHLPRKSATAAVIVKWLREDVVGKYGLGEMVPGVRRGSWAWKPPED